MPTKRRLSTVLAKAESRTLSMGPLRSTPVGKYSQDQLESARLLVAEALKSNSGDEELCSRLELDLQAVEQELERRAMGLSA
jgi:hypothetical protein